MPRRDERDAPVHNTASLRDRLARRITRRERAFAMRHPAPPRSSRTKALPAPPDAATITLTRAAFGPRPGDLAAFNALGANDPDRVAAWTDQQLAPESLADTVCDSKIAAAGFSTIDKSLTQLVADHITADPPWSVRIQPLYETERLTFLRALYSERQLLEILTDFWHNHFNVYANSYWIAPIFVHYDRDIIRDNALGNFHTMISAVAKSTEMLYYLDNYTSSNAGPNENFARELFELHALGAENYLGVMRQNDVPQDAQGRPIGYVDDDVYEATRCFTGWSFDSDTGLFEYRADWHDRFQKNVLGVFMPADQPNLMDGEMVLYALAEHPGTGRHIARKLCRRLISDDPPESIVDAAAAVFTANTSAPDQLAQVVRTILVSDEFLATWGEKIKRPLEIAASAMRASQAEFSFALDDDATDSLLWRYDRCGQPLWGRRSPDGYPDVKEDWQSANPRISSWRLSSWLVDAEYGGTRVVDVLGATPSWARSANELADFWIDRVFGRAIPAGERHEIVEFMAQGHHPDSDLPIAADTDTQDRLRAMVGVLLNCPSFLWR